MAKPERINEENVLKVNLEEVVRDQRFKDLDFSPLRTRLSRVQAWFKELDGFQYSSVLGRNEARRIAAVKQDLIRLLGDLNTFEIRTTNDTAARELSTMTERVESLYEEASHHVAQKLMLLRQETAISSQDTKELEKQQKMAAQAEQVYRDLATELKKEFADLKKQQEELEKRKDEVASSQGEVVAITLGKSFEAQAKEYSTQADNWLSKRDSAFGWLRAIIIINILLYIWLFITDKAGWWPHVRPVDFFTLQYALAKLALLALLSYAISFTSRNYNINAGLSANNIHRKNVAETLLSALASPIQEPAKAQLMSTAAEAMFKHLSVGYIKKENQTDSGPIGELLRRITGGKD